MSIFESRTFIIIPARSASERLPGKLLFKVDGKSLLQRTWENCKNVPDVEGVYIATQDDSILYEGNRFKASILPVPKKDYKTGTEMAVAASKLINTPYRKKIIVVQGEWPMVNPVDVATTAHWLTDDPNSRQIGSLFYPFVMDSDPNRVKVVLNRVMESRVINEWRPLYFSRCPLPYGATMGCFHVGVYALNDAAVRMYGLYENNPTPSSTESEKLEQLEWLQTNVVMKMYQTSYTFGIDTKKDWVRYVKAVYAESGKSKGFFSKLMHRW